ncbi:hypothetical protein B0H13DRAFT_1851564 [Mycena leptocephala]|nr:hypothetical protein B0H13DRAFT_1851564 [Mycena leptocephala]
MERFQFAYGWRTQWTKTIVYALQVIGNLPSRISLDSITDEIGIDPKTITTLIESFVFPKFITRSPITLLRKITSQCIIFRCRALLSLQPIKQSDAEDLDKKIMRNELGMPFTPNTLILDVPLKLPRLNFPSIARINAGIAIDGPHYSATWAPWGPQAL